MIKLEKLLLCCCWSSVTKSCPALCDPTNCSTPGFPVLHYLLQFAQIQIHWVSGSNHLLFCLQSFPAPGFSSESALFVKWPKYWSFSFSISPSNEYSELISFRIDWFALLAVQGALESSVAPWFKGINSLTLSFLLSNSHNHTWLL